jgi:glycosyltransferase involved in cell wall biosynthesis
VVLRHNTNKGYGAAIRSCLAYAKANKVSALVILDGDAQHNPDEIPTLLSPILQGKADLVIGSRFIRPEPSMPSYRKFGISVISFLWNVGSKIKVSDTQSGFRAYSKKLIEQLIVLENGMSVSIEILERARSLKAVLIEVPASCYYPHVNQSLKAIKQGLFVALSVIRIRIKYGLIHSFK